MTAFDKVAWYCSWCAPLGLGVALVSGLARIALRGGSSPADLLESLAIVALGAGVVGVIAHALLTLHILNASFLTREERSTLLRALHFSGGYGRWRATMRGETPS